MKPTADPKSIRRQAQLSANDVLNMMKASIVSRRQSDRVSQQKASEQIEMECKKSTFLFLTFLSLFPR
jgi:hypothetical protein